ncbi:MAG: AraC family transcriptional regulator, partial [Planctomycetota bacterium]
DLVLCGSQLPHTWSSDEFRGQPYDRHAAIVLQFHPEFLGPEFFHCAELEAIANMLTRARRGLWFPKEVAIVAGGKMESLVHATGASRLIGLLSVLDFLASCESAELLATEQDRSWATGKVRGECETRIQVICDHISGHLADPELSHKELAALAEMNASAFSRFFKQSTGRTVSAYINELRIGLASRLLIDTDDSIVAVSQQAGFSNLSNFNRRFRQLRQMTPRYYRTRFRTSV